MLKKCSRCSTEKNLNDFSKNSGYADGLSSWCKPCHVEYGKERRKVKKYKNKPEVQRKNKLKSKYNLTVEEYDIMLAEQDGVCWICSSPCQTGHRLTVDHCHTTEQVRGLLCRNCNTGLGFFKENIENLETAIQYLQERGKAK